MTPDEITKALDELELLSPLDGETSSVDSDTLDDLVYSLLPEFVRMSRAYMATQQAGSVVDAALAAYWDNHPTRQAAMSAALTAAGIKAEEIEELTYMPDGKTWRDGCYAEAAKRGTAEARIAELEQEGSALAADQCHDGYAGEHGHHMCRYQDRIAELEQLRDEAARAEREQCAKIADRRPDARSDCKYLGGEMLAAIGARCWRRHDCLCEERNEEAGWIAAAIRARGETT